jgi:hypothetical protein
MISIEALRAVRRIIVHANCPDGRASALILHAALPDAEVCEMAYGSPEHDGLVAAPGLLFCDFTPPKGRLAEFAAAGAIVLDHHERALVEPFGALGVFGVNDEGDSGAALAFTHVWCRLSAAKATVDEHEIVEEIALLASIRDTWQRNHPRWRDACEVSEVLRFVPLAHLLTMGPERFLDFAAGLGSMLAWKKREAAAEAAQNVVRLTVGGLLVAVVAGLGLTSDVADVCDADVIAGFEYVQESGAVRLVWSLRSRGGVDVQAIAKRHGGGGHKPAAGFSVPDDDRSPYARLEELLGGAS